MNSMAMLRHLTLSLVLAAALPFFAYAQISFPSLEPPASITAVPSSPAPGERVSLQAVTPVFDKDTTFYEWTINGQFRADLSGRGKYSAEVTAGPVGSAILVSVRATASDKLVATMSSTSGVSEMKKNTQQASGNNLFKSRHPGRRRHRTGSASPSKTSDER